MLEKCKSLRKLDVSGTLLRLTCPTSYYYISGNRSITNHAMDGFAAGLLNHPSIRELNMSGTKFSLPLLVLDTYIAGRLSVYWL